MEFRKFFLKNCKIIITSINKLLRNTLETTPTQIFSFDSYNQQKRIMIAVTLETARNAEIVPGKNLVMPNSTVTINNHY